MTYEYVTTENDFLTFYLHELSISRRTVTRRKIYKYLVPLAFLLIAAFFASDTPPSRSMAFVYSFIALLWFFFYPPWERNWYIKHFKKFIHDTYSKVLDKPSSLTISDDFICEHTNGIEIKSQLTCVTIVRELPTVIIIKLESGAGIIVPKTDSENIAKLKTQLKKIATTQKIEYCDQPKWVWK